jgi:hypothetical protein
MSPARAMSHFCVTVSKDAKPIGYLTTQAMGIEFGSPDPHARAPQPTRANVVTPHAADATWFGSELAAQALITAPGGPGQDSIRGADRDLNLVRLLRRRRGRR